MNNNHTIYFEARTGIIRDEPSAEATYQYTLPVSAMPILQIGIMNSMPGRGRLDYAPGFLAKVCQMELDHLRGKREY